MDQPVPSREPTAPCDHGGAFFDAIGDHFETLDLRHEIVNADVLDAWFAPSPTVLTALREHLPWLLRTSPPTHCAGMVRAIAAARGVREDCILVGAGSSDLIYRAIRHWLSRRSSALILDPCYGEYAHVLEHVVGCRVERHPLDRSREYQPDLDALAAALRRGHDLAVLVNPNSPTGRHIPREQLVPLLETVPETTRVWIDETYVDFAGPGESVESYAASTPHVVVCKSMSKAYGLSGARAAYLCAAPGVLGDLRAITPPWAVSLVAQIAAVNALQDPAYYSDCWALTREHREDLASRLTATGALHVVPGVANFLLCLLHESGPTAAQVVTACRERGVFLRDASNMGTSLGRHALRVAVRDRDSNARIVDTLGEVLRGPRDDARE